MTSGFVKKSKEILEINVLENYTYQNLTNTVRMMQEESSDELGPTGSSKKHPGSVIQLNRKERIHQTQMCQN